MILSELSKKKYIYKMYESRDQLLHVEKYPIVYANSAFIYFKVGDKQSLGEVRTRDVFDDIDQVTLDAEKYRRHLHPIYIVTEGDVEPRSFEPFGRVFKQVLIERAVRNQKDEVLRCKRMYEYALGRYEELIKEMEV